eukprot:3090051-Pyramimonas_sp.AAC.1
MVIPGAYMYRLLLGKGARVFDLIKTPSRHLALEVDEYDAATEAGGATAFTITPIPQCEEAPALIEVTADTGPI